MKFNVTVPVKPYVKRFLENNYGTPVDFKNHPRENEMFQRMLKKPCISNEYMYNDNIQKYCHIVEIVINDRDFYHYGWELSKTDIISFGKYFERNAKMQMRNVVGLYVSLGFPLNIAIAKFQNKFHFEEEYWSLESIQKDFYRHKKNCDLCFNSEFEFNKYAIRHLEQMILINMTAAGFLTDNVLKEHKKRVVQSN
jgi:hypothetical protein